MKVTLPDPDMKPPFDAATIKTEIWAPGKHCFTLDPLFVARPNSTCEDDGWIVLLVHNGDSECTELCVLDAQHIPDGALRVSKSVSVSEWAYLNEL